MRRAVVSALGENLPPAERSSSRPARAGPRGSQPSAPRIGVTNVVASNTGDAAILESLLGRVEAAFGGNASVAIHDSHPDVVAGLYPHLEVRPSGHRAIAAMRSGGRLGPLRIRLNRARMLLAARAHAHCLHAVADRLVRPGERARLRELAGYDLIISTGGTYLVETYSIWPRLLDLEIVLALGRPLVLFTQSLGPFADHANRRQIRKVVDGARLVLLRDERSRRNLAETGADLDRVRVVPDAAFALADPGRIRASAASRGRVAISVREWPHHGGGQAGFERYLDAIASAASAIAARGIEIVFISTCQGVPEYASDDSRCAHVIVDRIDDEVRSRCRVDADFHSPQQLIEEFAGSDAVISTRMHGAILAMGTGVPVLPIAYEFKTRELFFHLGLGDWVTDIEDVEPDGFTRLALSFIDSLDDLRAAMAAPVLSEREVALETADDLRHVLPA